MDNLIEVAHAELMQRVFVPVDDEIPDPEIDFQACVDGVVDRVRRTVDALPENERHAYFLEKARSSLNWCRKNRVPDMLTKHIQGWLARLESQSRR